MSKLIFKDLYLFSPSEKLAKNNKYELLCQKDYDANVSLLRELNNK